VTLGAGSAVSMRWEYHVINTDYTSPDECEEMLDRQGKEGWELVSVDGQRAYFKREFEPY
jgi:hypothetical protein